MEKCNYYHDESTLCGHGFCFAQKETPPCFLDGNMALCKVGKSTTVLEVYTPPQTLFGTVDIRTVINWIRNCNNLKELKEVKMEISDAIIHFYDPKDDDDFRSRA